MRVIIFPHAGGGKLFYRDFWNAFNVSDINVIQYPGREEKIGQDMPESIDKLADMMFNEYKNLFNCEYVIWGHSMGSTIGYEVAKRCEKILHKPPIVFFSSGASAPNSKRTEKEKSALTSDRDFEDLMELYGGIPAELKRDKDFCNYFYPIIRGDMKLLFDYMDIKFIKLHCPVRLIEGTEDEKNIDEWKKYTDYDVNVKYYKGGHFFINDHKKEIAGYIEKNAMEVRSRRMGTYGYHKIT